MKGERIKRWRMSHADKDYYIQGTIALYDGPKSIEDSLSFVKRRYPSYYRFMIKKIKQGLKNPLHIWNKWRGEKDINKIF